MSALQCLAIIGKANEPLYLKEIPNLKDGSYEKDAEDVFGFTATLGPGQLSLRKELMIHACLDSLEEVLNASNPHHGGGITKGRTIGDSKWIGLLCPMDEFYIYGYVTSTNIKILAMVSESIEVNHELYLKTLFSKVHNLFVEYVLNPWSVLQSRIDSIRFNEGVDAAILEYSEASKEESSD